MNQDQQDPPDDALRERLRSLDPAASLPPADPAGVARLLEDTMTDTHTDESRADHARGRSRLTWLVAAAAVVLIGAGAFLVVTSGDDDEPGSAADDSSRTSSPSATADTVTALTATGDAGAAKCLTPEMAADTVIASQTTVFDGVVESISGSVVTLRPTHFYAGDETDLVTVEAPSDDMQALLSAVKFEEGKRYLVAATDDRVTLCSFSGEYTDSLAAIYRDVFEG